MIRSFRLGKALAAVAVLAIGCQGIDSDHQSAIDAAGGGAANPFADSGQVAKVGSEPSATTDCVELRLDAAEAHHGDAVSLRLDVENHCIAAVAILTAPLEVVVLKRLDQSATWPMGHAVYAELYVQPKESQKPQLNYLADGGLRVLRPPKYFRVPEGASAQIPVLGAHEALQQLPSGDYWLILQTPIALAPEAEPMESPFDLRQTVEKYNSGDPGATGQSIRMPPGAVRMGAATAFKILPAANGTS